MGAIPLRLHAIAALGAICIFWCGAGAGMLILHSTNATEPTITAPQPTMVAAVSTAQTKTVRLVAVRSTLPAATVNAQPPTTFDDRWSARESEHASQSPVADASARLVTSEATPVAPERQQDKVCGIRGRYYFHIGHHKYWRCRRG